MSQNGSIFTSNIQYINVYVFVCVCLCVQVIWLSKSMEETFVRNIFDMDNIVVILIGIAFEMQLYIETEMSGRSLSELQSHDRLPAFSLSRPQWFHPPIIAWYIFLAMLQTIGFILWPLGPFDLFSTCNNFTVRFFKATGHIRLYWRNLVNTDSIFRLVSCRDISPHCLWKRTFFFPFRYWATLKIDSLRTNTVMLFFVFL